MPPGTHIVKSPIEIPSNVVLEGDGATTILRADPALAGPILQNADREHGNSNIRISKLRLEGDGAQQIVKGLHKETADGIFLSRATRCSIESVEIVGPRGRGVFLRAPTECTISRCRVDRAGGVGIHVWGANLTASGYVQVVGCSVSEATTTGILLQGVTRSTVEGCQLLRNGTANGHMGIFLEDVDFCQIRGNTINHSFHHNIAGSHAPHSSIVGNTSLNAGTDSGSPEAPGDPSAAGVELLDGCPNSVVSANVIDFSAGFGIAVARGSDHTTIVGNLVSRSVDPGIYLGNVVGCVISGNVSERNAGWGIEINDGCSGLSIVGNSLRENGSSGIRLASCRDSMIANNVCLNNGQIGSAGDRFGIWVTESGPEASGPAVPTANLMLMGNRCGDDQVHKTQQFGMGIEGRVASCSLIANDCHGNAAGSIKNVKAAGVSVALNTA